MKILILTNHSYMFWQFRRELTEELLRRGHEVVISTPFAGHEDDLAALGCRVIETKLDRRGINPLTDLGLCRFYRRLMKDERPELVITYSIKPNIYGGMISKRLGIPYAVNVQGLGTAFQRPLLARLATFLYKRALRGAKTTFFENEGNAREFVRRGIQSAESQTLLRGAGINLEHYEMRPYPQDERMHFLYLGRIMKEKGMDELFSAVRRLADEGYEFLLDLVGFYEDEYKDEVDELCARKIAVFHGFQADPRPFYELSGCVVLPSYHEGMSNVLLEAAATGRPLITSDIYGCREAVIEGESGLLCPQGDADGLYECMKQMLLTDASRRAQMGVRGREHMQATFEKSRVVGATLEKIL